MAKLEGVKTLDMVNGEITKVAYGGAEYVKTDSPVQEGDLFLLTEGHKIISGEAGEFYLTEKYRDDDIIIPTRYLGNATATQRDGEGIAFRKVAASTNPSVEERVTKAEGEIESLKFDVAALKGATEPKPERLKVGEYAKVVKRIRDHSAKIGEIVIVKMDDKSEIPYKCDKLNGERSGWFYEDELVRATDEEVAEAKGAAKWAEIGREVGEYKEGDVVAYDDPEWFQNSGIGEVIELMDGTPCVLATNSRGSKVPIYVSTEQIELITPVEARFDR